MYELPKLSELAPLIGKSVEAITFTANTIHFVLSNNVSITLESGYQLWISEKSHDVECASVPVSESGLMVLIGDLVKDLESKDRLLKLIFTSGRILALDATSLQYESLRIQIDQREIFV